MHVDDLEDQLAHAGPVAAVALSVRGIGLIPAAPNFAARGEHQLGRARVARHVGLEIATVPRLALPLEDIDDGAALDASAGAGQGPRPGAGRQAAYEGNKTSKGSHWRTVCRDAAPPPPRGQVIGRGNRTAA